MLNIEETYNRYGYYPDDLSYSSMKPIILNCNYCNKEMITCKNSIHARNKANSNKIDSYLDSCCRSCWTSGNGYHTRYNYNKDIFSTIDSEEKAYWLGFIGADGCIDKKACKICLSEKDKDHLEKFRADLNIVAPVTTVIRKDHTSNDSIVRIASTTIYKQLAKYGITQNKSLTFKPDLSSIDLELHRHFWRGMIDGDGSIVLSKKTSPTLSLTGSYDLTYQFSRFIKTKLGIDKCPRIHTYSPVYYITYSASNAAKIANVLYENTKTFLSRKKERANILIQKYD